MLKAISLVLFFFSFLCCYGQQDCMGTEAFNVNPLPQNGGYAPGTVVEYCVTFNNWNTTPGTNWLEGFDMTLGAGWDLGSLTPTQFPPNAGGAGSGGQWLWVPNQFNGNPNSAGGAGNQFGPGFFFDLDTDGSAVNDWGDFGTGPWTFCFEVTVGNTPGASLSLQVAPVSDGFAGSWGQAGCGGYYNFQISPGNTVLGCLTPPVISLQSSQDASCNGAADGNLVISVANGNNPFIYTLNGGPPSMFGGGAFFGGLTAGNYVIVCTDDDGCVSNVLNAVINENSLVQNNTSSLQDVQCFGESTGSFEIASVGGLPPYTYTLGAQINGTGIFSGLPAGNYVVQVTDDNGCSNFHNVAINEIPQMIPQVVSVTDVDCFGESTGDCQISCLGGTAPYTYQWGAIANGTGIFTDLFPSGAHVISIVDDNGCQAQQPILVSEPAQVGIWQPLVIDVDCFGNTNGEITVFANGGSPPYSYELLGTTNFTGVFSSLPMGNHQVLIQDDNGCQFLTPLISVGGPQMPISSELIESDPTCFAGFDGEIIANISGGTAPYSIVWGTVPLQNGTIATGLPSGIYSLNVIDANGCPHQNETTLFQPNQILVTTNNTDEICFGQSVELNSFQQNAVSPYIISWSNNQSGNTNLEGDIVQPPSNTIYDVLVVDANGCEGQAQLNVTVNPLPDPSFTESSVTGCDKHCVDFNINNPDPNASYVWTFGDASISFSGTSPKHCYTTDGLFTVFVKATSPEGCQDSLRKTDLININKTPTPNFSIEPGTVTFIDNPNFNFVNLSVDSDEWFWNFGDSTNTQSEDASHRYEGPGDYCVKLVAIANYSTGISTCVDSIEKCVRILPLSVCYVPNSFSPNGDLINDLFTVKSSLISNFEIMIHNRWGQKIYHSYDPENGWDGRFGEVVSPSDVYFWTIKYRDINWGHHQLSGNVFLLR